MFVEFLVGKVSYRRGVFLVLVASICWSMTGLGLRHIEAATVWQIVLYRSLALAPFLFIVITQYSGGRPFHTIYSAGFAGVLGGLALVVAFIGGTYSIQSTTVANAMFLFAIAPFIAAVLGIVMLRESVRWATWISMAVATVGVAIMVADELALGRWAGNAAALAGAFGFSVFTITLRWKKTTDMMPAVLLAGVFSIIITSIVCLLTGLSLTLSVNDASIAWGRGVFQIGMGQVLYTAGCKALPAGELALLSMSEVVLGPFWVWLFLAETISLSTLVGGGILLAALAGNAISGLRRKPPPLMVS